MFNFYSKLSPAQQLVVSGVASLLGTAIVVTLAATYQLYTEQGQLNIGLLINFAIGTFAVLISKSLHDYVPAHVQLELQAVRDSESQAHDALARSQAITQTVINKNATAASQSQPGPLVVIHAATVATPAPSDVSKMETASVPVPQLPFPEPIPLNINVKPEVVGAAVFSALPDVPTQRIDIPAQPTMSEIPALHFGDSQVVPLVTAP